MRLRLEIDALPRLIPKSAIRAAFGKSEASFVFALIGTGFDMLLFVFIVKCFLNNTTYCYIKRKPTQLLGWVTK